MKAADYRRKAWGKLSGKWTNAVIMTLIYEAIIGVLGALSYIGVGAIAMLLVTGPLALGMTAIYIKITNEQSYEIQEMFDGFKNNFVNSFVLALLNELFTILWSLLFVIPGIVASYAYSMSFFILNDNPDMAPNDARKASIELMKGHKWELFCLDFSFIGWLLLSVLTAGILSFWVAPYMNVAHAEFYKQITGKNDESFETGDAFETSAPLEDDPFAETTEENA